MSGIFAAVITSKSYLKIHSVFFIIIIILGFRPPGVTHRGHVGCSVGRVLEQQTARRFTGVTFRHPQPLHLSPPPRS